MVHTQHSEPIVEKVGRADYNRCIKGGQKKIELSKDELDCMLASEREKGFHEAHEYKERYENLKNAVAALGIVINAIISDGGSV